jgi:hypothetical protein
MLIFIANSSPPGEQNNLFFSCFNAEEKDEICKYGPFDKTLGHIMAAQCLSGNHSRIRPQLLAIYFSKSNQLFEILF